MRFLYPHLLWFLLLLPLIAVLRGRKGAAPSLIFSSTSLVASLAAKSRKTRPAYLQFGLRLAVLGLLILAAARPQLGNTTTEIQASGIDILLAVDVSGSMEAMDFTLAGKAVTRLAVVQKVVDEFIEERPNDRIGLVGFGGRPYLVCPLTLDHDWLRKRLESLSIGMIEDGTAIGSAIGSGINRLRDQDSKSRILILLTDGMNNSGRVPPLVAAEAAETLGIKVYTIGAGTRGEAPMPVRDAFGRQRMRMVRVDIDEKTLSEVAEMTGAQYFRATDSKSLARIYDEINTMETTTRTIKKFENYRELFSFFVIAALLLLGLELAAQRKQLP
ncbi:vWA domain-containing protein [Desulfosediminicola flagellatus]|uniref:vWA domain-containing protein n=1 Tax=Desulfosediminicola flagellatus TaxID=2569541 RepID=UPI0010ABFB00|nr:VWA domain-containing protein [Desulfosediminicola flagellatus]